MEMCRRSEELATLNEEPEEQIMLLVLIAYMDMCRRTEELATLNEELEEQTRMALDAQRAAESAGAELAQAQQRQAAAEQQAAELEERLGAELAAREDTLRSALSPVLLSSCMDRYGPPLVCRLCQVTSACIADDHAFVSCLR